MSDRCERCKKGYAGALPREDLEWPLGKPEPWKPSVRELRIARCTRCGTWLLDLWTTDPDRAHVESHDVCLVSHEAARAALLDHSPAALAAIASQVRRRHLELLVNQMPTLDRSVLEHIEEGVVPTTEAFRGLVTRAIAVSDNLPHINDVRPRARKKSGGSAAVATRVPLDLGDGSRVILEPQRERMTLARMRGDAVTWRREIPTDGREGFVARVIGRSDFDLAVVAARAPGENGSALFLVQSTDGSIRGPGFVDLRVAAFEAHAIPHGCTFVASYQGCALARDDASIAWKGNAAGFPIAVSMPDSAVVTDAPWRLVSLHLPEGTERWAIPIDRGGAILPSGEGHLLLTTTDVVARLDVRGEHPQMIWMSAGGSPLPLENNATAIVRERWERAGRVLECIVVDADGKRRFSIPRPEATKVPFAEIGNDALLFTSGSDVSVTVRDQVTYALSLPDRKPVYVTIEEQGAWIEYEGIVDRIDESGRRVGRWRMS